MDDETGSRDPYADARHAERLRTRIAAVLRRVPKTVPLARADGTTLLHGRRRLDKIADAVDRRRGERRQG